MNFNKLKTIVEYYINNYFFLSEPENEGYKWNAMQTFQDAHLLDGSLEDFPQRLEKATSMTGNLLSDRHVFARDEILQAAKIDSKKTSLLFKQLAFDVECDKDVTEIIRNFQNGLASILPNHQIKSHNDCRAISLYMSFLYPERFFLYKYSPVVQFMDYVEHKRNHKKGDIGLVKEYFVMASEVHDYLIKDERLMELVKSRDYQFPGCDPEKHLLTQDVIYSLQYMLDAEKKTNPPQKRHFYKPIELKSARARQLFHDISRGQHNDYVSLAEKNARIGDAGEVYVFNQESIRVAGLNLSENKKVKHVSKDPDGGDGLGYDILSYDENGEPIYIEVKTTASELETAFYITANELECSRKYKEKYRLYRVYNFKNGKGKIRYIKGPLDEYCIAPVLYKVCLTTKGS